MKPPTRKSPRNSEFPNCEKYGIPELRSLVYFEGKMGVEADGVTARAYTFLSNVEQALSLQDKRIADLEDKWVKAVQDADANNEALCSKIKTLEAELKATHELRDHELKTAKLEGKQEQSFLPTDKNLGKNDEYGTGALFLTAMGRIVRDDHNCEVFTPPHDVCIMTRAELSQGISLKELLRRLKLRRLKSQIKEAKP